MILINRPDDAVTVLSKRSLLPAQVIKKVL
jgi:hypothetical protein